MDAADEHEAHQASLPYELNVLMLGVANLSSVCAALWLLILALPRLPLAVRKRLFLRQLRCLAIADLTLHVTMIALVATHLPATPPPQTVWFSPFFSFGLFASYMLESLIAVTFSVTQARQERCQRALEKLPTCIFTLAAALSLYQAMQLPNDTEDSAHALLGTVILLGCLCISLASYCVMSVRLHCSRFHEGYAVQRRLWIRSGLFLLSTVLTAGPSVACRLSLGSASMVWSFLSYSSPSVAQIVAGTLLGMNGLLNVVMYTCQSRHFRQRTHRLSSSSTQDTQSFHVCFSERTKVCTFEAAETDAVQ